jgi:glycosyltransferase involved in cell wall biosynthesis
MDATRFRTLAVAVELGDAHLTPATLLLAMRRATRVAGPLRVGVQPLTPNDTRIQRGARAARSLRVLVLTPQSTIMGPVPKHSPLLVAALRRAGCEVVTQPWSRRGERETPWRKGKDRTKDLLCILRLAWRLRPDVVLVKTSHDARAMLRDLPLVAAVRLLGYPCVLQFHGSLANLLSARGHHVFKVSSRLLVCLSGTVLLLSSEECRQWSSFEHRSAYYLVANPFVAPTGRSPSHEMAATAGDGASPVVLYVGRLLREKGVLDLIQAFAEVIRATGAVLALAGSGPDRAACVRLSNDLGIAKHVHLLGYLTGDALRDAYESATVFAFPSFWPEGFPTVLSEAMAAGLPMVTTATRGAVDHLHEPENALFVPPREPDALAGAVTRLLRDRELAKRMGDANQEKVKDFAPDAIVHAYVDALEHAVGRRSHSRGIA